MIGTVPFLLIASDPYKIASPPNLKEASEIIRKHKGAKLEGNKLTFAYQGKADAVQLSGGIFLEMSKLDEAGTVWGASIDLKDSKDLVMSYLFAPVLAGKPQFKALKDLPVVLGKGSPKLFPAISVAPNSSKLELTSQFLLDSKGNRQTRKIEVFMPPRDLMPSTGRIFALYCADFSANTFVSTLVPLMKSRRLPPIAVIGVEQGKYNGGEANDFKNYDVNKDDRAREYLPMVDEDRFKAHMRFFTEEVSKLVEAKFPVGGDRSKRGVIGFSNGGVFAAYAGVEANRVYSLSVPLSAGPMFANIQKPEGPMPKFYCAAGMLEEGFLKGTTTFANKAKEWGADVKMTPRNSGHDWIMWREEGTKAMLWFFGKP